MAEYKITTTDCIYKYSQTKVLIAFRLAFSSTLILVLNSVARHFIATRGAITIQSPSILPPFAQYRFTAHCAPSSHGVEQHTKDSVEGATHKLNLFEKAKNARDAWKKHQKDVKNKKLKQSIRLVGPAEARDVAEYIKCDGRASGIGEERLEGCVSKEVS